MALTLADIESLFHEHGGSQYSGEPVTQLAHALQTAELAQASGADDELVTAALLHDLGHLLAAHAPQAGPEETPTLRGIDDLHQFIAVPFLRPVFCDRLIDAVQWHVDAKRYLCATRLDYLAGLSADSQRSLALQGGVFNALEAAAFLQRPHATEAIALRLWDDQAKVAGLPTQPLSHYLARARRCMRAGASA